MAFYVQYDIDGNITGTVTSGATPGAIQLVFDSPLSVQGKMVDIPTLTLVDAPIIPVDPLATP